MNFSQSSTRLKKYIISFIGAFLITVILQAVLSVAFAFFPPSGKVFEILNAASSYFSAFICAVFCARTCGKKGFLTGAAASDVYMAVLIFFGVLIFKNCYDLSSLLKIFSISSLCGAVGGIIGINCK